MTRMWSLNKKTSLGTVPDVSKTFEAKISETAGGLTNNSYP